MNRVVPFEFEHIRYAMDAGVAPNDWRKVSEGDFKEYLRHHNWTRTGYANGEWYFERGRRIGLRVTLKGNQEHYLDPSGL